MRFNFPEELDTGNEDPLVEVGNVYLSKCRTKTYAWVVVGISSSGNMVACLGIDSEGEITTGTNYNMHSMNNRKLIGRADLSAMVFDIDAP